MGKRVIRLNESDLKNIVKKVISEQTQDRNFVKGIQNFLNLKLRANLAVDGKTGTNSETERAISKYQSSIGVYPSDGVWGKDTWDHMPERDKKMLKDLIAKEGGLIDRFLNWIIKEQDISVQKNNDGKIILNGQKYKLQVKKGILGWIGVDIDDLIQTNDGWKVTASAAGISKTDIVPKDTISIIYKNLGQPTIDLGGKEPKRLVKA
jgi:hypothetical protein